MKQIVNLLLVFFLLPLAGNTQESGRYTDRFGPFHNIYEADNDFSNRKFIEYPHIREADVLWEKVTWQIIDMREKMNMPLYYPTDTLHQRKSLINAIMSGIEENQFTAFRTPLNTNAFEFDPNNMFMNIDEIRDIGMREEIVPVEVRPGVWDERLVQIRWRPEEIKQVLVKEVWYFSRKDSRLHVEIIGICPIREYEFEGMMRRQRLFWIYYPDTRAYLSTVPVYSLNNDRAMYSFDDLFVHRYFNSYFVQEANVYNDRMITDYVSGREAQLESDRIWREIFDKEQDMWEN